jgi:hypothetical protein
MESQELTDRLDLEAIKEIRATLAMLVLWDLQV